VALGPPFPPLDLDGCRVDDDVGDALAGEPAVQPEAIAAGFVTTDDGGIVGQAEAPLGLVDLLEQGDQVARPEGAEPGRWPVAEGEGQLPLVPAQRKSQMQTRDACGTLRIAGRCHDRLLEKRFDYSTHTRSLSD